MSYVLIVVGILVVFGLLSRITRKQGSSFELESDLRNAVFEDDLQSVRSLLQTGVNVNAQINVEGEAPLHLAAGNGNLTIMQLLLKRGAKINLETGNEWTPLDHAVASGNDEAARFLASKGGCGNIHSV